MEHDSKALLANGKALADCTPAPYDKAMLSTSAKMAQKLGQALKESGLTQTALAERCGVTKQAVQGWLKTGRIDKGRLNSLATVTGKPLEWWLDAEPHDSTVHHISSEKSEYKVNQWPFTTIAPKDYQRLTERQMGMVEGYIKGLLNEVMPAKRTGTDRED